MSAKPQNIFEKWLDTEEKKRKWALYRLNGYSPKASLTHVVHALPGFGLGHPRWELFKQEMRATGIEGEKFKIESGILYWD